LSALPFAWLERLPADLRRLLVLVLASVLCSMLVVEHTRVPSEDLSVGEVAPRTLKAPTDFRYQDFAERERRQREAVHAVPPVFRWHADLVVRLKGRLQSAFASQRDQLLQGGAEPATPTDPLIVAERFHDETGVMLTPEQLAPLIEADFPPDAEQLALALLDRAMGGRVLEDHASLPANPAVIRLIEARGGREDEITLTDLSSLRTPQQAMEQITLAQVESPLNRQPWADAVGAIVRYLVYPNVVYDAVETERRRSEASARVAMGAVTVERGAILFRQGDVLTETQVVQYHALRSSTTERTIGAEVVAISLFLMLLLGALFQFGASYLQQFSTSVRDVTTAATLLVLVAFFARVVVASSDSIALLLGGQATAASIWFLVPAAGATMLVRMLIGVSWSVVFAAASSVLCGLIMDLGALYVVFFLLSSVAAAGAVAHTRERIELLRAGAFTGLFSGILVVLLYLLQLFASNDNPLQVTIQPMWGAGIAFAGGLAGSVLVLALIPLFEASGYVTDYRLLELASLNHPLLRQLMLRAPGTYHHSVIVGSLAEAACEAIGANALQVRVAAYFHDIGKGQKPQYFVENQRSGNRHDRLDPYTSARIIISHVHEGGRMAREYNLPKPITDNVYMHHGTGFLPYFYNMAKGDADDPNTVDASAFRYPGPKPDSREAGVLMLADKIEAATRTIQEPNEDKFRAMIARIINSVMADGQFENCPLNFREIHVVADSFVHTLLGIHHHRIEYAGTASISRSMGEVKVPPLPAASVITLDILPEPPVTVTGVLEDEPKDADSSEPDLTTDEDIEDDNTDYESLEYLPKER